MDSILLKPTMLLCCGKLANEFMRVDIEGHGCAWLPHSPT
jgi:hypothetical protein